MFQRDRIICQQKVISQKRSPLQGLLKIEKLTPLMNITPTSVKLDLKFNVKLPIKYKRNRSCPLIILQFFTYPFSDVQLNLIVLAAPHPS